MNLTDTNTRFKIVTTLDELIKAYMVRAIVFLEEQKVSYAEEVDEHEYACVHILGETGGEPMAAGRMRFLGDVAKLERICVRQAWRGQDQGHRLVDFMLDVARQRGFKKFKMHAQSHLTHFYSRHGFQPIGDLFDEAGIPHIMMIKEDADEASSPPVEES
ncbi:GNAT family N-acetyltransferase [bacterium]|nr:GNAT family N-acetyltransferase [bacterium]